MSNVKEKLIQFLKIDSPQKLSEYIPENAITFLLAFPTLIFISSMAIEFFKTLFLKNNYRHDIIWINFEAAIVGAFAVAVYFLKLHYNNRHGISALKNPTVICFSALVVLMILSTLRNGFDSTVLFGDLYRCESLGSFIVYPTVYYFVSSLMGSEKTARWLINGFLLISFMIASATLLNVFATTYGFEQFSSFTDNFVSQGVIGIYHQINHYGYSLVIAMTLSGSMFVSAEKLLLRIFYLAGFILFNVTLILNDSFGAYLAVFTALVFLIVLYIIRDRRINSKAIVLLGVFITVSFIVNFKGVWANISALFYDIGRVVGNIRGYVPSIDADGAGTTRWRLWKSTFKMISERPLLGFGVEGIAERLTTEAGTDRPHNELLQYAAFFGIPALICYVSAVTSVFINSLRRRFEGSPCTIAALTAAFGYFVSSLFGNTMYYTAPLFFIALGMADMRPPKLRS